MSGLIKPPGLLNAIGSMKVFTRDGLVVVEFGEGINKAWFALSRVQTIELVQALANCANSLGK